MGECGLPTPKRPLRPTSVAPLVRAARERAEQQARRIPWQRLLEARTQYIDWQEFYLWVRSIVEVEGTVPAWLAPILDEKCPGFLAGEKQLTSKAAKARPLGLRLEDWIEAEQFGFARQGGWFSAIQYYAIRDPRYQRAEVCWTQCVKQWKKVKPERYPTSDEWKETAATCDPTANLLPGLQIELACLNKVAPAPLAEAVARYLNWEAFSYWARAALERQKQLPAEVARELGERCPGFLEFRNQRSSRTREVFSELLRWIKEHCFSEALDEGWFEAILYLAGMHPRAIRTQEYADYCDELWGADLSQPYPSFAEWRRAADAYVETDAPE
jgi:hypothetical protein